MSKLVVTTDGLRAHTVVTTDPPGGLGATIEEVVVHPRNGRRRRTATVTFRDVELVWTGEGPEPDGYDSASNEHYRLPDALVAAARAARTAMAEAAA